MAWTGRRIMFFPTASASEIHISRSKSLSEKLNLIITLTLARVCASGKAGPAILDKPTSSVGMCDPVIIAKTFEIFIR